MRKNRATSAAARRVIRSAAVTIGIVMCVWTLLPGTMIHGGEGFGLTQSAVLVIGVIGIVAGLTPLGFTTTYLSMVTSLGLALIIAEATLQTLYGDRYYTPFEFHERYLFKLTPGATKLYTHAPANGGHSIAYSVNSQGFRGPELEPPGSLPRIVVYGDSFIQGEFSALEETFVVQLDDQLTSMLDRELEVVNAGTAGYGPDQVLRRLEDELAGLDADLLILALYAGNDFGDLLRNRLYLLGEDDELIENDYVISRAQAEEIRFSHDEPIVRKLARSTANRLIRGPHPDRLLTSQDKVEQALVLHQMEYEAYVVRGDNVVGAMGEDPYTADISLYPDSPSAVYKVTLMGKVVRSIKQVALSCEVPLMVVVIPHPVDVFQGTHESGQVDLGKYPEYQPATLSTAMTEIARRQQIPYVNLFPTFTRIGRLELYLRGGDDHWSGFGQRVAARAVADHIVGLGVLDPSLR